MTCSTTMRSGTWHGWQDRLPPAPFSIVPALFREELQLDLHAVFSDLEQTPIASASIATVYRGRLRDGRVVAVKVRRPDVARTMAADLRLLRMAGRFLGRLPFLRLVPVEPTLEDFCVALERQLDLTREARTSRRLRQALRHDPDVIVPAVVEGLCSPSILTMEFINGMRSPHELDRAQARIALRAAVRALYRMIFLEGCIHCDLHQGNLGFLRGGRAAIIDFGFVAEITDADRLRFAEFFYAMSTNNGALCARITRDTALSVPAGLDYEAFEAEVVALVDRITRASAGEFQVADFVGRLFDIQRRFGLRGSSGFVMPILALLVIEGIVKDVAPGMDFQSEAYPFVQAAARSPQKVRNPG